MLSIKTGNITYRLYDKMDIKNRKFPKLRLKVGAENNQMASKAHKAEQEIYSLVVSVKGCTAKKLLILI